MKIRIGFVSNSSSSSFVADDSDSLRERINWLENDLREAKHEIEDLQEEIGQLKHLLDTKGISW
jgi:peptidoglycan hydrolase CwlO-like protein